MPTYDYLCKSCGHRFEHFQSITDEPLCTCPECSLDELKRLIGAGSGIIFRGTGFYETDYRSASYKAGQTRDSSSSVSKSSSTSSKSTSKDSSQNKKAS